MGRLSGKVAIVTGGGRGIGAATSLALAQEGARVCLSYSSQPEAAAQVLAAIEAAGGEAFVQACDVREAAQVDALVAATEDRWGRIDVLVNNAGVVRDSLVLMLPDEDWQTVLDVNLTGTFRVCRAVARCMLMQRSGCIINLSSVAAARPGRGQANYAASKGGIESFTRALASELGRKGVRVNAVAPGVIVTEMSADVRAAAGDEIQRQILLRRFGSPADVARAVVFLASDDAAYITGEVLHVDGGLKL